MTSKFNQTEAVLNKIPLQQESLEKLAGSHNYVIKKEKEKQKISGFINTNSDMEKEIEKYFKNKRILITGASMGLGEALAEHLSTFQTKLILCARTEEKLQKVAQKCEKNGSKVLISKCDVTEEKDCENTVKETINKFGGIDVLILNAGISGSVAFSKMKDLSLFGKMMNVNFMGYVNMTFHALPEIKKTDGRICVISSLSGKLGIALRTPYCASKHAVNGFFDTLRNELAVESPNVKITTCVPSWIDTSLRTRHLVETQQSYDQSKIISVDECVTKSLFAVSQGKREERYSGMMSFLPFLTTIEPELVDSFIKKAVYGEAKL
eukprot:gene2205-2379_t